MKTPKVPLAKLKGRLLKQKRIPKATLKSLERDERAGARALARALRAKIAANKAESQRLTSMLKFETELYAQGVKHIAGVDEAGMAPLAGPVVAAAVILPRGFRLRGLDDSKKIVDENRREELAAAIRKSALAIGVGFTSVEEIDSLNIYQAGLLAMRRAIDALSITPDFCLIDARNLPNLPVQQRGIIHGDALSLTIAAASIIAKTTRDAHMAELDALHPGYGLRAHKGYPTPEHQAALERLGPTAIHRKSFAPVRKVLGLVPVQAELFQPVSART